MGRSLLTILDNIVSLVHLKLKFHNIHGEPITIDAYIKGTKRIYKALHRDQLEGVAIEINVASLK